MDILEIYNKYNSFGRFIDMNYEIITPGEIVYKLKSKPEFLATKHAVHGGLIAAFMDAIVGVASLSAVIEEAKLLPQSNSKSII